MIDTTDDERREFDKYFERFMDVVEWSMDFYKRQPHITVTRLFAEVLSTLHMSMATYLEDIEQGSLEKMAEMAIEIRKELIRTAPRGYLELCDEECLRYPSLKRH
jgi:3-dehydroquinate dehydratase